MPAIYLTPSALSSVTLFIFAGLVTGYLLFLAWQSEAKPPAQSSYITLSSAVVAIFALLGFFTPSLYPNGQYWIFPAFSLLASLGIAFWVQFAYHTPAQRPQWQRENRIVLFVMILFIASEILYVVRRYATLIKGQLAWQPNPYDWFLGVILFWGMGVFIRQIKHADPEPNPLWRKLWQPANRHSRAGRGFIMVNLILMAVALVYSLYKVLFISTTYVYIISSLGVLLAFLTAALTYLNYLPERSSFLVRQVIITLAFFLGILGAVGHLLTPAFIASYHEMHLLALPQTLRFSPNAQGGYDIRAIPQRYVTELGEELRFENATGSAPVGGVSSQSVALPLDFSFPFYDQQWSAINVIEIGLISFGGTPAPASPLFQYDLPAIYLLGSDSWWADGMDVYAAASPEGFTLTWLYLAEEANKDHFSGSQLRLYPDGIIEMTFGAPGAAALEQAYYHWHANRLLGLVPGERTEPEPVHFRADLPISSGANGVIETYHRDFRAALHHFLAPLFWLILISAAVILLGLPLVFRQNLAKPLSNLLAGVRQIDQGKLDVQVPVMVEDEFGYLTHSFNTMAADLNMLVQNLEKRVAERTAELSDTAAYLDNILRSATDYAITAVDDQFKVVYINPLAEKMYGVFAAEVLGKSITAVFDATTGLEEIRNGLNLVKRPDIQASPPDNGQYTYLQETPNGPRHIAARFSSVRSKNGATIGYAHFSQDITEQLQTEAQLLNQQRALSALEERERIGRELHDGIGQVMGYLNLQIQAGRALLADGKTQAADKLLEELVGVTQTAHNNVREFILGMNHAALAASDFWTALHRMAQTFEDERGLPVRLSLPAGEPFWVAQPDDLHLLLIIQEALVNAYKHAGARQVQIIAQQITPQQAQFIISDDGCGFDISQPARRSQPSSVPHFGLSIMRERALELGGDLEIRSNPGEGTQVLVTIQIASSEPQHSIVPEIHLAAPLRVLLVDDHPLFLEGMANLLNSYGVIIAGTAHNGLQAQSLVRSTQFDLILMDIEMPVCDGIEATRRIVAEFPDQDIIMLTTSASDETLFAALKAGASGYLLKSMAAEELFMLIAGLNEGAMPLAPELAGKILAEFQQLTRPTAELTDRQRQILQEIAAGNSYREIAQGLHYSERTIKREMKEIMAALHLNNRAEAEDYARRRF